jgi:hypothetical protein
MVCDNKLEQLIEKIAVDWENGKSMNDIYNDLLKKELKPIFLIGILVI